MNRVYKNGKVYYKGGLLETLTFTRYMTETDYQIWNEQIVDAL